MALEFDFASDDATTGFRLKRFELYNWGTYDKKIVTLDLSKHNGLLTGDIGSGKSTIVDALTTLLVPHQKITFNKAAGAEAKERSLRSYILGEYKSSKDEAMGSAKAIALRDESHFSVLLTCFENDGFDERLILAQFFHIHNKEVQKFYIISKRALSIKEDFIDIAFDDIRGLKKYLRAKEHTKIYESFKDYSREFKRVMGIRNDQALNLFYQTVSLKSIGNLTNFVQDHMLEKSDIDTKIDELCKNFSELNHTHELVLSAKQQIELLKPIESEAKKYEKIVEDKEKYEVMRGALPLYFAGFKKELIIKKLEELAHDLIKAKSSKEREEHTVVLLNEQKLSLHVELQNNGGDRIHSIADEIKRDERELGFKKEKNGVYNTLAKLLELGVVSNEHRFLKNAQMAQVRFESIESDATRFQNEIVRNEVSSQQYKEHIETLDNEIIYLENNRSNIPKRVSNIRDEMAKALDIAVDKLPFAGELIEVNDDAWQGAIERVLHSFSLSLLVEDSYYDEVSAYVNSTNLKGKLIYLKVSKTSRKSDFFEKGANSLIDKLTIKHNSTLYDEIKNLLLERFDIACVESMNEFKKYKKALSITGQVKTSFSRHEKDDRFDLYDKSRWTLGWDNLLKLKALKEDKDALEKKLSFLHGKIQGTTKELVELQESRDNLRDLLQYKLFSEIDWYQYASRIENLKAELKELTESSDIIKSLEEQINIVQTQLNESEKMREIYTKRIGEKEGLSRNKEQELSDVNTLLGEDISAQSRALLQDYYDEIVSEKLNLHTIGKYEREIREKLQNSIDTFSRHTKKSVEKLLYDMNIYTGKFSVESKEFDASIESLYEFRNRLKTLKKDDLPQFEKRFKALFKEKTIQKTAMIKAELDEHAKEIQSKISKINNSLKSIEYNSGTYIELIAERAKNREIKEFKEDLKSAISYAIGDDNSYDEAKFMQIKTLIDRFNGRDGYIDIDKKWRANVTDVRNWYSFSASEKYSSDSSEKEFYAHSGGKSGGQKEKLAYTVLASSLAYQFGLEHNEIRSRSFRFVMIDEAFGRGSDESSRYALRLFEKLNLQLLVITPKQKINIIEPFVKSVHFVHNQDGMNSSLLSMSIQEYSENKNN